MRNFATLIAVATLATAAPIAPVHADRGAPGAPGALWAQEALPFCEDQVAQDPTLSLGTCMSYFVSGEDGYVTQFCHYLQDQGELGDATFAQCVEYFHQSN